MSAKTKIFITGATGYIGGSVLEHLQNHPDAGNFEITAIVRSAQKVEGFKKLGVNAVVGSFSDAKLLEDLTAAADIVIDAADSDALEAVKVMLRGCKRKFQETGRPPIFIHTSGTGVLIDDAVGFNANDIIWDDANPDQLERLSPAAPHRNVDLELTQADKEGYVRTYIVVPSSIYGLASGKFADAGLQHKQTVQIPVLINAAIDRGQAGMIGKGVNIWPNVDIDEVADLYIDLYNAIKANPDAIVHGRDGFYFALNGEHTLYDISKELGRVLVAFGKCSEEEPTTFTQEEVNKYFNGSSCFGTNSRGLANHSRAIGWRPKKTTKDFLASIKPEVEETLRTNYKTTVIFP